MAGRIARLLGRRAPDPPELADALAQLGKLAEERPELAAAAAQQAALLRATFAGPSGAVPLSVGPAAAAARLEGGLPLLREADPPIRPEALRERMLRLCAAVAEAGGPAADAAAPLAAALRGRQIEPWGLARSLLAGEGQAAAQQAEAGGIPGDLTMTLLRLALLPAMAEAARGLEPLLAARPWRRGHCPVCGAWATLAEQRGLEQFRYLRCGLCAASWEVDRLYCPACDCRDHTRLGYLQVEEEEQRQRVAVCDECRSYLKVRTALRPLTPPELIVAELALVHLDLIALERGYAPPG